jgi:poly-gamma-glutamate synthesis protein (capsule biosynthesis protein)
MFKRLYICLLLLSGLVASIDAAEGVDSTRRIVIAAGGDVLLDRGVKPALKRYGVERLFAGIRNEISEADFAIANLECPLTMEYCPLRKRFNFRADTGYASGLRNAGWTHLSMANNHTNDQGREGVVTTADVLRRAGICHVGYGGSQQEAAMPAVLEKDGLCVAVFASVLLPLENWMCREDLPGPSQATVPELCDNIRAWKKAHAGHHVLVLLHWGREHSAQPEPEQAVEAHALIDAGADVVLGHHPHVVQTIEKYGTGLIVYSVGNLLFDQYHAPENEGVLALFTFTDAGLDDTRLVPLSIGKSGMVHMSASQQRRWLAGWSRHSPSIHLEPARDGRFVRVSATSKDG